MHIISILLSALLFGGMVFYSFGFAPMLFKHLPAEKVRTVLRGTFPYYYLVIIILGAACTAFTLVNSLIPAIIFAVITASTIIARQILMPKINTARDADNHKTFKQLHTLSVVLQLLQIILCGFALSMIA